MTVKETNAQYGWPDLGLPDDFDSFVVKSTSASDGAIRLDGGFYDNDTVLALATLHKSGLPLEPLSDLAETFSGARFRRVYVDSPENGTPYLAPSDAFDARPRKKRFLSNKYTNDIDSLVVHEGWTLVTCSGSIGKCIYTSRELTEFVLSHDLIRVRARDNRVLPGFIYAYLSSKLGFKFLTRSTFGKVIDHIEPHHVDQILVPRLGDVEQMIHEDIESAAAMRTRANELLIEAEAQLYSVAKLPRIGELCYSNPEESLGFTIGSHRLVGRLDAGYHEPYFQLLDKALDGRDDVERLCDCATSSGVARFKHIYLESGVPYFGSADIFDIQPEPVHFVSAKHFKNFDQYLASEGSLLLASSGSVGGVIGNVAWVYDSIKGSAISNHVIRIVPRDVDAGYLFAYLSLRDFGYGQLMRGAFGASIPEISPSHCDSVRIPRLRPGIEKAIGDLVREAFSLRETSHRMVRNARDEIMRILGAKA